MPIAAGSRIGPYEIVGWLGAGGMGEVYRARDARLDRDVAIKVIPESLATDPSRVRRFEQEARAAGQLNHPHVLAVYDVGFHMGAPYIVSELLEGESLRSRLEGGGLAPRKAIDYARQVADGLSAAHDKNIVHRDIKPDNVFITADGRVKILDFGVAKLTMPNDEAAVSGASSTETAPEGAIGTVGYMSPEQARGEAIDGRSDIFSLGAVLHEMLTGRPAFVRSTTADTIASILKEDPRPPVSGIVPPALERILARCLEKAREARFQSARDLAFDLEFLAGTAGTAAVGPAAPGRLPILGVAVVAAVVVIGWVVNAGWLRRDSTTPAIDFAKARFSYFTQWPGTESLAEISPDGTYVAFVADKEGQFDTYVSQIGSGEFPNLTSDLAGMNPPGSILRTFGFSGDGAELWYSQSGKPADQKRLIRLLSRTSRPFLGKGASAPAWSPDNRRIVYFNSDPGAGDPMFVADSSGANARQIVVGDHNHNPVWSQDGQWIYYVHGKDPSIEMDLWRVRPSGESAEQLTRLRTVANFLTPLDANTVLFVATAEDRSGPWLWTVDVGTRTVRRVSVGVNPYTSVSASLDGRRIVATVADPIVSLWTVPILDATAQDSDVQPYPVNAARAHSPRFLGSSVVYLSARDGGDGLWRFDNGEASEVWAGTNAGLAEPAAVSRDKRMLALVVREGGRRHLVVMSPDGTNRKPLATDIDIQGVAGAGAADFSPDGAWIVAGGIDARGQALFKIPIGGGAVVRLVDDYAVNPIWSPDGKLIAYAGRYSSEAVLRAVDANGRVVEFPKAKVRQGGYRFMPDGSGLVYLQGARTRDFWMMSLATGQSRQLTNLGDYGMPNSFDVSPDGKQIVFDRTRANSNIALIELPRR